MMREEYIREELKATNGNVSKVARRLDLDYAEAKRLYGSDLDLQPIVRPIEPMPDDITILARPGWEKYIIAVKANATLWPSRFTVAIHDARRKFDEGTHIMCQEKRNDGWVIQYLIPRKYPLRRPRPFFARNWGLQ